jgi:phosphonopyruvate decarboxylase
MESNIKNTFGSAAKDAGIDFVCGVPDSLLKHPIAQLRTVFSKDSFFIAANEGSAIGLAIGHHLSGGYLPLVFLQNSGLGNAFNPLVSLAHPEVYGCPLILLIGWRGEVDESGEQRLDEPQHIRQGQVTLDMLGLLEIPYLILDNKSDVPALLRESAKLALERSSPVALVVRASSMTRDQGVGEVTNSKLLSREEMIQVVADFSSMAPGEVIPVVSTTGMSSRELYEIRNRSKSQSKRGRDFLTVGGMGHAISIATAISLRLNPKKVICLDGDGALLMHAGSLLLSAQQSNLIHVLLDNGVHDSVGGEETGFLNVDSQALAKAFGYKNYSGVSSKEELLGALSAALTCAGSYFIHVQCAPGHRNNLGRPSESPIQSKIMFMEALGDTS